MTRVRWTDDAVRDVQGIRDYISQDSSQAALRVARRIVAAVRSLKTFPLRGRAGHIQGTREMALAPLPYVIVFRVESGVATILRVHHGAQNRA